MGSRLRGNDGLEANKKSRAAIAGTILKAAPKSLV